MTVSRHTKDLGISRRERDRTDIAGLEEIARRGAHLLTASDAELDEAACRSWCEVADGWLTVGADAVPAAEPMLTALVRESPALEPRVVERLHRLMELSGGSEGLRREVAARLSKLGEESSGG